MWIAYLYFLLSHTFSREKIRELIEALLEVSNSEKGQLYIRPTNKARLARLANKSASILRPSEAGRTKKASGSGEEGS